MSNRQRVSRNGKDGGGNDRDGGGRAVSSFWRRSLLWRQLRRPDLTLGQMATAAILIAIGYAATGWAGLQIPFSATYATLIWAPSGIALYGVLRWGWAGVLGTALGILLLNLSTQQTTAFELIDLVGACLAAIVAACLLVDGRFDRLFGDPKRVTRYLTVAVLASPVISAAIGAAAGARARPQLYNEACFTTRTDLAGRVYRRAPLGRISFGLGLVRGRRALGGGLRGAAARGPAAAGD